MLAITGLATPSSSEINRSLLVVYAGTVDDLEKTRIETGNRIKSLQRREIPVPPSLEGTFERLKELEKQATKVLEKAMNEHELGAFAQDTYGLGLKGIARLVAATGDMERFPGVRSLWKYCGFHVDDGKSPRRKRGEQSRWSENARMRARLCAESCIKQMHSPYRKVYDAGRKKYEDEEISDLQKHNRALRLVAKQILKDLWNESKRLRKDVAA